MIGTARGKASIMRVTSGDRKDEDALSEEERVATIFAREALTATAIAEILTLLEQIEKVQGVSRVARGRALMGD